MNEIFDDFEGKFDFIWFVCVLEYLGLLKYGLDFIKYLVECLKLGGVVVYMIEFNLFLNDDICEYLSCFIY